MMKRRLGTQLKVSHMMVARVWAKHGLKPQRLERYMASNDPDFEQKAADIIGLYLNPPAHAAVFCVDEKTAIQALDRKEPVLPLSPGRADLGMSSQKVVDLSGLMGGEVVGDHVDLFAARLVDDDIRQEGDELRRSVTHGRFAEHLAVHLHFTPTYSSWLNQIELWFSKIERDVIARGVFTSVPDLRKKLMKYIRHYNNAPKTVKWRYFDPTRCITPSSAVTVH
jgi:transposase